MRPRGSFRGDAHGARVQSSDYVRQRVRRRHRNEHRPRTRAGDEIYVETITSAET